MTPIKQPAGSGRFSVVAIVVFLSTILTAPAIGQERPIAGMPGNVHMVAATGSGICSAVSAQNGVIAIGSGSAVEYWDVSTPATPVRLGSVYLHGPVFFIKYEGAWTYVGTYDLESDTVLHVISSNNPANPVVMGSYLTQVRSPFNQGWAKVGDQFYISDNSGTDIVDVSVPTAPAKIGTMTADANAIAGFDSLLFVIDNMTLRVMSNATPAAPSELGNLPFTFTLNDVAASADGQHVFVAEEGIKVVNVATPGTPSQVGEFSLGSFIFFSTIAVSGTTVYAAEFGGVVHIIDVSNPDNPIEIGQFDTGSFDWLDVAIASSDTSQVYVSVGTGALGIDLTVPSTPAEGPLMHTGYFTSDIVVTDPPAPPPSPAFGLQPSIAYASDGIGGVYKFEFDGVTSATVVKKHDLKFRGGASRESIARLSADVVFVSSENEAEVVDMATDPPVKKGGLTYIGSGLDIEYKLGFAYIAQGGNGNVSVVDVSNQTNPSVTTTITVGNDVWDVNVDDVTDLMAAALGFQTERMRLYSLTNPTAPTLTSGITDGTNIRKVYSLGNILFGADYDQNIYAVDITDPANPTSAGSFDIGRFGEITRIEGSFGGFRGASEEAPGAAGPGQSFLYVATSSLGLVVIDATNPASMKIVGSYNTADWASAVEFHGGLLYVGDGNSGTNILQFNPPQTPILISNFEAAATPAGIHMQWRIDADEPIAGFDIYREEGDGEGLRSILDGGLLDSGTRQFVDETARPGGHYTYHLAAVRPDQSHVRSAPVRVSIPSGSDRLLGSHPNPFNPSTTISFELAQRARVTVTIYDAAGRRVAVAGDRMFAAGRGEVKWDGRNNTGARVASGVYLYTVRIGKQAFRGKVVVVK